MKAVISSTYDDKYLYFLPIVCFCWQKLNVDVICFMPEIKDFFKFESGILTEIDFDNDKRVKLINETMIHKGMKFSMPRFSAPEHKEATYAQCSRLYGACLDLPEDEVIITSDIDMAVFKVPPFAHLGGFTVLGADLVPDGQLPMCYATATVKDWRDAFELNGITYQQALDRLLGEDECQDYRACRWSVDQEQLRIKIFNSNGSINLLTRSNGQNQFAQNRYDRDDQFILDRLSPDTIDFHMNRPGYEEKNFEIILTILKYHYPQDDFEWLKKYTEEYNKLL